MKKQSVTIFLNALIEVFLQNFIFYIPREIIFEGVLDKLEGEIEEDLFDSLAFLDIDKGISLIKNEDALEINNILFEKRSILEKNIFTLLEKHNDCTPIVYQLIIEKYFDQLLFYLFITEWLTLNLKKYNEEEIHLSIVGAFKLQHESLCAHLKDFYNYFEKFVDIKKNFDFSTEKLVNQHFPDLISRFAQSVNKSIVDKKTSGNNSDAENKKHPEENLQLKKKNTPKKKQKPQIIDNEIEKMILEAVFKVKI